MVAIPTVAEEDARGGPAAQRAGLRRRGRPASLIGSSRRWAWLGIRAFNPTLKKAPALLNDLRVCPA